MDIDQDNIVQDYALLTSAASLQATAGDVSMQLDTPSDSRQVADSNYRREPEVFSHFILTHSLH